MIFCVFKIGSTTTAPASNGECSDMLHPKLKPFTFHKQVINQPLQCHRQTQQVIVLLLSFIIEVRTSPGMTDTSTSLQKKSV